jgi:WD40 repeat protein
MKVTFRAVLVLHLCVFAVSSASGQRPTLQIQTGHNDRINSIAFSPDGKLLASGGDDQKVKLWAIGTGVELRAFATASEINSVAFSPDGKLLAAGGDTQPATLWDLASSKALFHLSELSSALAFSPNGQTIAVADNRAVNFYSTTNGARLKTIAVGFPLHSLAFHANGKLLAGGGYNLINQAVLIWDVASGEIKNELKGHTAKVWSVAFSPDGKTLASGSDDKTIKLWDVATGKEIRTIQTQAVAVVRVEFSPDGKTLLGGGGLEGVKLYDVAKGRGIRDLEPLAFGFAASFSPDGSNAAVSTLRSINLKNVADGKLIRVFAARSQPVGAVSFAPDKQFILSADDNINIWDVANGSVRRTLKGQGAAVFSFDGSLLATEELTAIHVWETSTGIEIQRMTGQFSGFDPLAFSPDGKTLASRGAGGIDFWKTDTGTKRFSASSEANGQTDIAYSPDGKLLASGSNDGITLFEASSGKPINSFKGRCASVRALAFSVDNRTVACGCYDAADKPLLILWDAVANKELRQFIELAGPKPATDQGELREALGQLKSSFLRMVPGRREISVAFSQNGKLLATVGKDANAIRVWDASSGALLRELRGHSSYVNSLMFSPNGQVLISGSGDATTKLWEVASGRELATLVTLAGNLDKEELGVSDSLVVTPDGLFDGTPAAWQQIRWRFSERTFDIAPVEVYFNELYYPGLLADLLNGKRPLASKDASKLDRRQPVLSLSAINYQRDKAETRVSTGTVLLQVAINNAPGGARDLRLFRNGSLVQSWHGDVALDDSGRAVVSATVPIVAGENRFTAYAFNRDNIKSEDASLVVTGADSLKRAGTLYVLAIGVNEYENKSLNLTYAVPDAEEFGAELKRQQEMLKNYERSEIVPLYNEQATKEKILGALTELASKVKLEDAVVVYFAGHGTVGSCSSATTRQVSAKDRFYLVPSDLGFKGEIPDRCEQKMLDQVTLHRHLGRGTE